MQITEAIQSPLVDKSSLLMSDSKTNTNTDTDTTSTIATGTTKKKETMHKPSNSIGSGLPISVEELKEALPQFKPQHFVFAYGSLICKKSRAISAPTLADKDAIPVQIQDVERIWAKRTKRGMTAMGVRFRKGAICTGVVLPVTEAELARFDNREVGYDRYQIPLEDVDEVPFLADKDHYEEMDYEHAEKIFVDTENDDADNNVDDKDKQDKSSTATNTTASAKYSTTKEATGFSNGTALDDSAGAENRVFVWIYVQRYDAPADEDFPIAQSYVDIIMRGCMGISKEFARSFIETTKGWSPEDIYGEGEEDDEISDSDNEDDEKEGPNSKSDGAAVDGEEKEATTGVVGPSTEEGATWVDDREDPIYMRADVEYSEKKADVIDAILEDHVPEELDNRELIAEDEHEGAATEAAAAK